MKKLFNIFLLSYFLSFGLCFGAKELLFEEIGFKFFVQSDGVVSFVDCNKEDATIVDIADTNNGNTFKEIFRVSVKGESIYFIIWPLGIYEICDSGCKSVEKFSTNQCIKLDKYFLFLRQGKVYLGKEDKPLIHRAPIPQVNFVIESIQWVHFYDQSNKLTSSKVAICGDGNRQFDILYEELVKYCDKNLNFE
jgi:hypothetical protein